MFFRMTDHYAIGNYFLQSKLPFSRDTKLRRTLCRHPVSWVRTTPVKRMQMEKIGFREQVLYTRLPVTSAGALTVAEIPERSGGIQAIQGSDMYMCRQSHSDAQWQCMRAET